MEYQKIVNFLDSASNQPSKFRTKNWFEHHCAIEHQIVNHLLNA